MALLVFAGDGDYDELQTAIDRAKISIFADF